MMTEPQDETRGPSEPRGTTVADLMAFIDRLPAISTRPRKTIENYRMAAQSLRHALHLTDTVDLAHLDIDTTLDQYENAVAGRLAHTSILTYTANVRRVTHRFLCWAADDPTWDDNNKRSPWPRPIGQDSSQRRTVYRFPLRTDMAIALNLPNNLTHGEADRLARFITALPADTPTHTQNIQPTPMHDQDPRI
jgi:hypothetical protein